MANTWFYLLSKKSKNLFAFIANENYYYLHSHLLGIYPMFVCMCFGVTDKDIQEAVQEHGVGNIRELKNVLTLGEQCGTCIQSAQAIIDDTIIDESLFKDVG